MQLVVAYSVLCAALVGLCSAAGAGRAFPIKSENYVIQQFKQINSKLEWDASNGLVDKAGLYANCKAIGESSVFAVEGEAVSGVRDYTDGDRADTDAVHEYITAVIDNWVESGKYRDYITTADTFGCSVRPGCSNKVVVVCLFSPGYLDNLELPDPDEEAKPDEQNAQAFTPEQYKLTESYTGNEWDRSHFLENLSGYETDCTMLNYEPGDWRFSKATAQARDHGITVFGINDYSRNLGSTDDALVKILKNLKSIKTATELGCSLIPDCIRDGEMFVVASCVYRQD